MGGADDGSRTNLREPVPKLPHLEDPRFEVELVGERVSDLPGIFVFRDVMEELCYRAVFEPEQASACLLTGSWFVGPYGPYVEIYGFRDTTFVDDAIRFLHHLRAQPGLLDDEGDERVIGCALLRPGSQGRMSADELVLLNTFFNLPEHVLLVVDGQRDQFGFYARDEHARFHNCGAYVIAEANASEPTLDPTDGSVVGRSPDPEPEPITPNSTAANASAPSVAPETEPEAEAQPLSNDEAQPGEEHDDGDR